MDRAKKVFKILLPVAVVAALLIRAPVLTIPPGTTQPIHCDTSLSVHPTSTTDIDVDCDPLPTETNTPIPPTDTSTSTVVVPTATDTAVVPTATNTPVPPTSTNTAVPPTATKTPTVGPTLTPAPSGTGIWISPAELAALPMSGTAWNNMVSAANGSLGTPDIQNQDSDHDVLTLAVALVAMRTNNASLREKAASAILAAVGTEAGGRTLALGRNLVGYVVAADIIDLKTFSPSRDATFRAWLTSVRTENLSGLTLVQTQEQRPNNWGTHAGAALVAADLYLGDTTGLTRAVNVFHGYLGARSIYAGFSYGDLSWQCNASLPVGINPLGCTKSGHSIDGVIPDDQRRTGSFAWPPPCGNYTHGSLQGTLLTAEMLHRAGYDSWNWENQAILRSYQWLYSTADGKSTCPATGDDTGSPYLVNDAYGSSFPETYPASLGKSMGWNDWTHR